MKRIAIAALGALASVSIASDALPQGGHHPAMEIRQAQGMPGPMPHGMPHAMPHGPGMGGAMPAMPGHGPHHGPAAAAADSPATAAFKAANAKMHREMDIAYTGDADVDFLKAMIPHHQGAIDMARVVLAFGKDPEVRKLAEEIVRTQEAEIAQMRAILERLAK